MKNLTGVESNCSLSRSSVVEGDEDLDQPKYGLLHVLHNFIYVVSTTACYLGQYEPWSPSTKNRHDAAESNIAFVHEYTISSHGMDIEMIFLTTDV